MNILQAPASYGTTTCEYSVACTREADKIADTYIGTYPICDFHIEWYKNH